MKKNPTEELNQKNPASPTKAERTTNKISPNTPKRETEILDEDDDEYGDVEKDNVIDRED